MAYTSTNLTTIAHLKALAEKAQSVFATQSDVEELQTTVASLDGAEENVIESVSVNGTALTITDKSVDVTVPTTVSELTNDADYQTGDEVDTAIATAISESGHASYQVVESVPDASDAQENILYLVMNSDTDHYDIYALISGEVLLIDDTTVDLTAYPTTEEIEAMLADYTTTTDLTALLATKVDTTEIATDDEVTEMLDSVFTTGE